MNDLIAFMKEQSIPDPNFYDQSQSKQNITLHARYHNDIYWWNNEKLHWFIPPSINSLARSLALKRIRSSKPAIFYPPADRSGPSPGCWSACFVSYHRRIRRRCLLRLLRRSGCCWDSWWYSCCYCWCFLHGRKDRARRIYTCHAGIAESVSRVSMQRFPAPRLSQKWRNRRKTSHVLPLSSQFIRSYCP